MPADAPHFGGIDYPRHSGMLALHLSVGPDLFLYRVEQGSLLLSEVSRLKLPAPVQYVWPHPLRSILYVASSNRSISKTDDLHTLTTVALDSDSGLMRVIGEVSLPTRPIHLTTSSDASSVLVVYNGPALITAHAIDAAGVAGPALPQSPPPRAGYFPHQVLMLPSAKAAVVVARGNHASAGRAEEPGSFEFFSIDGGRLSNTRTVAPGSGIGFGPRHLAFHPGGRWAAVSVERHNQLQIYPVEDRSFASEPAFSVSTLEAPPPPGHDHDQLTGTVHFHPSGEVLYIVNRHDPAVYGDGKAPADHAGNNIAVYAFNAATGEPTLIQRIPTESVHVRTFSLDAGGRLLVAASILPSPARRGDVVERIASRLSFFTVGAEGRLTLARIVDMPNERDSMFWSHLNGSF